MAELQQVLDIDPEDLMAHYNLMLCYKGLGRTEDAARYEELADREAARPTRLPAKILGALKNGFFGTGSET